MASAAVGTPVTATRLGSTGAAHASDSARLDAYLLAFFQQHLGGTTEPLLAGSSVDYPEVIFKKRP